MGYIFPLTCIPNTSQCIFPRFFVINTYHIGHVIFKTRNTIIDVEYHGTLYL